MAADIHIDEFNRDTAVAITRLYNNFPHPMALYVDEICRVEAPDEYGVISDRHQRCIGALLWLAAEHIIRFKDTIGVDGIEQAVLTLPALQALHSTSQVAQTITVIHAIRGGLKEKSSESLKRSMHEFYHYFIKNSGGKSS